MLLAATPLIAQQAGGLAEDAARGTATERLADGVEDRRQVDAAVGRRLGEMRGEQALGEAPGAAAELEDGIRNPQMAAGVVEISLDQSTGKIRVHKVWVVADGGTIVLPDGARANIESGILYGISSMLTERITMKKGVVEQSNFHDYNVLRMSDAPEELHVGFVKTDRKPTGLGEIGNPFIGGAIANAVFAMTGKRLQHLPFTPDRVLAALKA